MTALLFALITGNFTVSLHCLFYNQIYTRPIDYVCVPSNINAQILENSKVNSLALKSINLKIHSGANSGSKVQQLMGRGQTQQLSVQSSN